MALGPKEELGKKLMKKDFRPQKYEEDVIEFTKNLRSYSPKAYEYLRSYLALPSKATLNNHSRSSKGLPGKISVELETHKENPNDENTKANIEPAAKKLKTDGDDSSEVTSAVEYIQDQKASLEKLETLNEDPIEQNASLEIDGMSIEELIEYSDKQENSAT